LNQKIPMTLPATAILILLVATTVILGEVQDRNSTERRLPRFQDYAVSESEVFRGPAAALKLPASAASDVRAKLTENATGQPNFAGHYEFVTWGCGTNCTAGAIVDFKTGIVYSPPLNERTRWLPEYRGWGICAASWDGPWEARIDSRLIVISCGWNYDAQGKNWPDVYYLVWRENQFNELLHIRPPKK